MKPRKHGIWIIVATIVTGCGVMLLISWAVMTNVFRSIGELAAQESECLSKVASRETIETTSGIKLPDDITNLEIDSLSTPARECFVYVKFEIDVQELEVFLTANLLSVAPGLGQGSIREDWILSDIAWPYDDSQSYLSGNMSSGQEELTTVAVDISRGDSYTVYAITYLM
jgi:hypothetical protein